MLRRCDAGCGALVYYRADTCPRCLAPSGAQPKPPSSLPATSWILVDADSQDVLASQDPASAHPVASATKLMTYYVAADQLRPSREIVVAPYDPMPGESLAGFEPGDTVTARDAFYGLLVPSGNDAALTLALAVSGSESDFVDRMNDAADELGLRILDKQSGKYFYFLAACAGVTDDLRSRLKGAALVFFDGPVWRDDELIAAGLGNKTGQGMGHIAMSGDHGAIESLNGLDIGLKVFLHINNSNPALLHGSDERKTAEQAGWHIPADGMEITL